MRRLIYSLSNSRTRDIAWNFKWDVNDRWALQNDVQWVHATDNGKGSNLTLGTFVPGMGIAIHGKSPVMMSFDQPARDFLANPGNYFLDSTFDGKNKGIVDMFAWKVDV